MTSGSWGSGAPSGDGAPAGRRAAGDNASSRIGSARVVIGMASLNLTLLCVVITFATWTVNGVTVLAVIFLTAFIWAIGAHRGTFWSR